MRRACRRALCWGDDSGGQVWGCPKLSCGPAPPPGWACAALGLPRTWAPDPTLAYCPPVPAANFSVPVVNSSSTRQDQELTFMCTSTNGYPRPNVYWVNKTDDTVLDRALHNDTVSLNERGLYDVVSVLRVPWAPGVSVGCCIENVLLRQNLTGSGPEGTAGGGPKAGSVGRVPRRVGPKAGSPTVSAPTDSALHRSQGALQGAGWLPRGQKP